jgi:hypothetical protein
MLTVEFDHGRNAAIGNQAGLNSQTECFFVEDGRGAWKAHAYGTAMGIRLAAKGRRAGAKHFGSGQKFYVDLKSDHGFPRHGTLTSPGRLV